MSPGLGRRSTRWREHPRGSLLEDRGAKATSLRMVQQILVRSIDLGLVEKIRIRKDAYYRTVGLRRLEAIDDISFAAAHWGDTIYAAGPRRA
jgi:hypothetical protein